MLISTMGTDKKLVFPQDSSIHITQQTFTVVLLIFLTTVHLQHDNRHNLKAVFIFKGTNSAGGTHSYAKIFGMQRI